MNQGKFLMRSAKSCASLSILASAIALSSLLFSPVSSAAVVAVASNVATGSTKPLLMEGKTTLYQRVLSTPSCLLHERADLSDKGKSIPAFSQFYVYAEGKQAYKVGANALGRIDGYLAKDCIVPWKQQLALLFTNPANRSRTLIFDDETALDSFIDTGDTTGYQASLEMVTKGQYVPGVVSIEPAEYVDYQKNFYLLPILNSVETMFDDGSYTYKHEIASIVSKDAISTSDAQTGNAKSKEAAASNEAAIVGFKNAVVFVVDSSISMQPYIDRTRQAINTIYKKLNDTSLLDKTHFGVVSFRADTRAVPKLEYVTKMYVQPGEATNVQDFNTKLAKLKQARVSSAQFNEDSYAGISMALQDVDWSKYGGRYVVLITDAGAIDADEPQSSTQLDANALRLEAERHGVALYTLHLLTKAGKKNHQFAKEQYSLLSYNKILGKPLYYPVAAGAVDEFGQKIEKLASDIVEQVVKAMHGEVSAGAAISASDQSDVMVGGTANSEPTQEAQDEFEVEKLGLAMRLAYLGRLKGTQAPDFMRGWMADRDMSDHNKMTCEPVVLVNRNQLSDLFTLVKGILKAGVSGQVSSDDMFAQLQSLAAQMGRDPSQLSQSKSISEMGIMGELLDDLPYKSRIASLSPEDWFNLGSQEQERIVRELEKSLNYIKQCSEDNDRFIKLNEFADESEAVYPIPLDALP